MNELKQTILTIIAEAPGAIKTADIRADKRLRGEEPGHISQRIFALKEEGLIIPGDGREYSVTAKGLAALGRPAGNDGKPKKVARASSQAKSTGAGDGDGVENILIKAERAAQNAIDDYLASIGDPNIFNPLRASRDAAREALKNYRERQA